MTSDQLAAALSGEQSNEVRIGSRLLEIQALPEDLLLHALSEQLAVPMATAEDLRRIPEEVQQLLPANLARRCEAIPFRLIDRCLHVAMLEVHNLQYQDEIAFATGLRLKIHIANEARIHEALERYYDAECPPRFTKLLDLMNRSRYLWSQPSTQNPDRHSSGSHDPGSHDPGRRAPGSHDQGRHNQDRMETFLGPAPPGRAPAPEASPTTPPADTGLSTAPAANAASPPRRSAHRERPKEAPSEHRPVKLHPRPVRKAPPPGPSSGPALEGLGSSDPGPALRAPRHRADTPQKAATPNLLVLARHSLRAARHRDDIGRALLTYFTSHFDRVALIGFQQDLGKGWIGAGGEVDQDLLELYRVEPGEPSVFLNLKGGAAFHLGPLLETPAHNRLLRCFGERIPPEECLVLPVQLRHRMLLAIYADRIRKRPESIDLAEARALANEAASAFGQYLLRNKQTPRKGAAPAAAAGGLPDPPIGFCSSDLVADPSLTTGETRC